MELKFRTLKANEIEVRVGSGGTLLLYKDARVDMALLDEVVGVGNWQREHKILGNDIYCKVGIFNKELNCWVWVEDAGSSGNIEIEKTKASDSFKRACVNLGIGRELYTAPKIVIPEQFKKCQYFDVSEIEYNKDREISKLTITTNFGKDIVFQYPRPRNYSQTSQKPTQNTNDKVETKSNNGKSSVDELTKGLGDSFLDESTIAQATKEKVQSLVGKLPADRYAKFKTYIKDTFGVESVGELTEKQGQELLKALGGK